MNPTWNMAPSGLALVFHDGENGHVAELLKWGFLPSWAKLDDRKPINARVETAAMSPYFRRAWKSNRCLIPADGWYEWKMTDEGNQPYFIHDVNNQPVMLAGLYETNHHANATTFTILTMQSGGALGQIHEREPLVFSVEAGKRWIRRDLPAHEINKVIQTLLTEESFSWHTVSTKVNSAKNDGPELIRPQHPGRHPFLRRRLYRRILR